MHCIMHPNYEHVLNSFLIQKAKAKPEKKEAEKEAPFVNTTPVGEKKGL